MYGTHLALYGAEVLAMGQGVPAGGAELDAEALHFSVEIAHLLNLRDEECGHSEQQGGQQPEEPLLRGFPGGRR